MNILMATFWKKKITGTPTGNYFKLSKKNTFFYKESGVVYPIVQLTKTKKGFQISDIDFIKILQYVEINAKY